jgi:hypothetical protein
MGCLSNVGRLALGLTLYRSIALSVATVTDMHSPQVPEHRTPINGSYYHSLITIAFALAEPLGRK